MAQSPTVSGENPSKPLKTEDFDFDLPSDLISDLKEGDWGRYGKDGELVVCFTGSNHTTGGNSGSPVINAYGELIGTAFDGNWEAMSGDIYFEPNIQRTISVDIRYTLFIIDKYAGAKHLIDEMNVVTERHEIEFPEMEAPATEADEQRIGKE